MRIVVIGGSGLVGAKLVNNLRHRGHDVLAASPQSGVNTMTGEGLAEAITGASVVVDVTNSPSFDDDEVLNFFQTSCRNLLAAAQAARVKHHVALSVVGTDRLLESGAPTVRVSPALIQPIASDEVAAALADIATAPPRNGIGVTRFDDWLRHSPD